MQKLKLFLIKILAKLIDHKPFYVFLNSIFCLAFILLNIFFVYFILLLFIPWTFEAFNTVINLITGSSYFRTLNIKFELDIVQITIAGTAVIAAYMGWIKYIGNKKIEQFNNLSERASKNEDDLAKINAITTLPIFAKKNPDNIFKQFILLSKLKEVYLFFRDLAISPQKNNRVINILNRKAKTIIEEHLPILDEYLGHVSKNQDIEKIREEYIKDYNHNYPYVEESINILKNILMLEVENKKNNNKNNTQTNNNIEKNEENNQEEKKENGFTPVETAVSEALTKITKHSFDINKNISVIIFDYCNLENIKFNRVKLNGASFKHTVMPGIDLKNCSLSYAYMKNANLQGANLKGTYLQRANLEGANLEGTYLQRANLKGANLQRAYLKEANLEWANLQRAYLKEANLEWANLEGADLKGANLEGANLQRAYLKGTDLKGASLYRADLKGAVT